MKNILFALAFILSFLLTFKAQSKDKKIKDKYAITTESKVITIGSKWVLIDSTDYLIDTSFDGYKKSIENIAPDSIVYHTGALKVMPIDSVNNGIYEFCLIKKRVETLKLKPKK